MATPFVMLVACTLRLETNIVQQTYVEIITRKLKMTAKAALLRTALALETVIATVQVGQRPARAALLSTSIKQANRH